MEQAFLLKSVHVHDPEGPWHERVVDLRIENGRIEDIGTHLDPGNARVLHMDGSHVSAAWVDAQVHFRDPGLETKEGLTSGLRAAAAGGFGAVGILPSTHPCMDNTAAVTSLLAKATRAHADGIPTRALPLAHISEGGHGHQITEMHDLHTAGSVAFTDDAPLNRVGLLQRALTYSEVHGKAVMDLPLDDDLNAGGVMHEGPTSTAMGVTGIPAEAESLRVSRDLDILRYAGGHLHFSVISSADSVQLVREAKRAGLRVTCGTTALHLAFCDEDLQGFVGTLRVTPPLRSGADRAALREAVLDGTVDVVTSDHRPEDLETHDVEFMLSPDGVAGLPSAFALALSGLTAHNGNSDAALRALLRAFTSGGHKVLSQTSGGVTKGSVANLTWFHPKAAHVPHIHTRGVNLPPLPADALGQVLGVFVEDRAWVA